MPLGVVDGAQFGVGLGVGVIDFSAEEDGPAYHSDAGPITENILGILRIDAADHGDAAAIELGKGVADRAEHPEFRPAIFGIPFGHGQTAGSNRAGDIDLAIGHGIAGAVAGIAEHDNLRADIEIANVVGG